MATTKAIRGHVLYVLRGGGAHLSLDQALDGLPADLRGARAGGTPYTVWRLLEHMRIAQRDILEFSRNPDYESPSWPDGFWPQGDAPPDAAAWERSLEQFRADAETIQALVQDESNDLLEPFPHGDGQTLLREALLVANHNAYHLGEMVVVRTLLGSPPPGP
ncbi:MAG: DinB family protein [Planctomycetota bacterium]